MSIQQQIDDNFLEAVKAKDRETVSVLRMIKSSIQNKKIEKNISREEVLSDDDLAVLLKSEIKKRKDSVASYKEGNRPELAEKEEAEIEIIEKYLPRQMSEKELEKIVSEAVSQIGVTGMADFGKVMGVVMKKTNGLADGEVVSGIVKGKLGG